MVQSLAESGGGRHSCTLFEEAPMRRCTCFELTKSKVVAMIQQAVGMRVLWTSTLLSWIQACIPTSSVRVTVIGFSRYMLRDCKAWRSVWVERYGRRRKSVRDAVNRTVIDNDSVRKSSLPPHLSSAHGSLSLKKRGLLTGGMTVCFYPRLPQT